jgi:hypothetical protein
MSANQTSTSAGHSGHDDQGHAIIHLRVQTPRGIWTMTEPVDAVKRPEYPPSAKIEQVIEDARIVFKFVEQDSKYTLLRGSEILEPQRTLVSYKIEDNTLLVLSVQGGNA